MVSQLNRSNPFRTKGSTADWLFGIPLDSYNPAFLYMNPYPATSVTDTAVAPNDSFIRCLNRIHVYLLLFSFPLFFPHPSNATDIVQVNFIVTQHIGTIEHHDPCIF